ncbi:MAG: hypothetical protein WC307_06445 [Candidatus Nanoarchaeia archaeon]|jgi:uncharacterized OB-fold protein
MSVYCGKCGAMIFYSRHDDWKTSVDKPEMNCQACNKEGIEI